MTYEILDAGGNDINTIVDDLAFMQANYPDGNYREVPEPVPVPVPTWVVTRNAFQNRFPMTSNGVSTKYDLMTLFLTDTGYAESLGVTGADLYSLRSMIITGNNRLGVVANVDLQAQETIGYVNMTTNAAFPEVFRLTAAEANTILTTPAAPNETP
jgi:hypothetical protein